MNNSLTPLQRMAPTSRTLCASKCQLRVCAQLPEVLQAVTLEIHQVWTDPESRAQGNATKLLQQVCCDADLHHITLIVQVKAYEGGKNGLSQPRLKKWYANKFGFQVVQENPTIMARPPCGRSDG